MSNSKIRLKHSFSISLIIYSFILSGNLSENFRVFGVMPHEIIIISFFFIMIFQKTKPNKWLNWVDRIYFVFFTGVVVLPILFNLNDFITNNNFSKITVLIFYIKLWIYYRVFLFLIVPRTGLISHYSIAKILMIICNAATIAALIGVTRFAKVPYLYDFIENTWPIKAGFLSDDWGRLVSTMGGTNTGGVFFAISSVLALYLVLVIGNKLRLFQFLIFVFTVLLSGSFTGVIVMVSGLSLLLIKNNLLRISLLIKLGFVSAIIVLLIMKFTPVGSILTGVLEKRSNEQFKENSRILPVSFIARYSDWIQLIPETLESKPLFGYGFQESNMRGANTVNYNPRKSLAENYYIELLIVSGIVGLLSFIYFITRIIKKLLIRSRMPQFQSLLLILVIMYLVAQFSQPTIKYGGLNELFGLIISFVYIISIAPNRKREIIHKNQE